MFWQQAHIRHHAEVRVLDAAGQNHAAVVVALTVMMVCSIMGKFPSPAS